MSFFSKFRNRSQTSKSNGRNRKNVSRTFERLEQRAFMAMDLMAFVNSGILTINGGDESDEIQIIGTANPGEYTVVAGANPQYTQTTINGQAQQTFSGVSKIYISLADGNNWISIQDIRIDNIEIHTGSDADEIIIGKHVPLPASGPNATNVIIGDLLDIYSGGGDDRVTIGRIFGDNNRTRVSLGEGNDKVNVYNGSFYAIKINGDEGDDQISVGFTRVDEEGTFAGGDGNDLISIYCSRFIKVGGASGENGSDTVAIDTIQSDQDFFVGDDDFYANHYEPGDFNDTTLLARSNFKNLQLGLFDGQNTLTLGKYYGFNSSNQIVMKDGGCTIDELDIKSDFFETSFVNSIEHRIEIFGCVIDDLRFNFVVEGKYDVHLESNVIDNLEMFSAWPKNSYLTRIYNAIESETIENFIEV